jgi:hypothetical protein
MVKFLFLIIGSFFTSFCFSQVLVFTDTNLTVQSQNETVISLENGTLKSVSSFFLPQKNKLSWDYKKEVFFEGNLFLTEFSSNSTFKFSELTNLPILADSVKTHEFYEEALRHRVTIYYLFDLVYKIDITNLKKSNKCEIEIYLVNTRFITSNYIKYPINLLTNKN